MILVDPLIKLRDESDSYELLNELFSLSFRSTSTIVHWTNMKSGWEDSASLLYTLLAGYEMNDCIKQLLSYMIFEPCFQPEKQQDYFLPFVPPTVFLSWCRIRGAEELWVASGRTTFHKVRQVTETKGIWFGDLLRWVKNGNRGLGNYPS